jgi:hypothetical protein
VDAWSQDALDRAKGLARACALRISTDGVIMLARVLDILAAEHGCAPRQVPLDVLGYWLLHSDRSWVLLGLPAHQAFLPGDDGPWQQMAEAARPVVHAWLAECGRLRIGDHVVITPEYRCQPRTPRRGVLTGARFDNPDHDQGLAPGRLGPDPLDVTVLLGAGPDAAEVRVSPWGLLLDDSRHRDEPGRATAIHAWNAARDLGLAGRLVRLQGPAWARGYLQWRAQFYPREIAVLFRDAAAIPGLDPDEIAMLTLHLP